MKTVYRVSTKQLALQRELFQFGPERFARQNNRPVAIPVILTVLARVARAEDLGMAIGSATSAASYGMNLAAMELLGAANSVASGNLNGAVQAMQNEQLAQVQFAASAKVATTENQMLGAVLDMTA